MTVWWNFEFDLCIWIEISRVGSYRYTVYLEQVIKYKGDAVKIFKKL